MFSCLRSFRVTNCRHAMPLVRGLGSSSFCTSQPKIYSDLFLKIQDENEVNTIKKHAPVYDRKNKYEPQFYEVVEQFLDAFARKPPPGRPPLRGWNCLTDQGETFHWKDTVDKNGVTRVKIQSEGDLQRHIEIHWDHHFILTYQHDPNERLGEGVRIESPKEFLVATKEISAIEKFLLDNSTVDNERRKDFKRPSISELEPQMTSDTFHYGYDVPIEWMMALKRVTWPKSFIPSYMEKVNYFEAFRKTHAVDRHRKFNEYHALFPADTELSHLQNLRTHLNKSGSDIPTPLRKDQLEFFKQEGKVYRHLLRKHKQQVAKNQ